MATKKVQLEAAVDNLRTLVRALPDDDVVGPVLPPNAGTRPGLDHQAMAYGVRVEQMELTRSCWCATLIYHLSPEANKGKRGVYVQAVDERGQRVRDKSLRIMYTWEGRQPWEHVIPAVLDKRDGPEEIGHGMIDINWGQRLSVWLIDGGTISDIVGNLHSMHPAEYAPSGDKWNYEGHHSFLVRFQRVIV